MIEFITVTHDTSLLGPLERSIHAAMATTAQTQHAGPLGLGWRLTAVDGTLHDLFTGYNAGAAATTGDILVFLHHDVQLLANAVAFERPLNLLYDPATGFIGIVGATRLNAQGTWFGDLPREQVMQYCRGCVAYPYENEL